MFAFFLTVVAWIVFPLAALVVGGSIWADINYDGSIAQKIDAVRGVRKDHMVGTRGWFWMGLLSFAWLLTYYIYLGKISALLQGTLVYGGWILGGSCCVGLVVWFSIQSIDYYRKMKK
jgi:hypothetical protein